MRLPIVLGTLASLLVPLGARGQTVVIQDGVVNGAPTYTITTTSIASSITFGSGVSVNAETGEVTIPPGLSLSRAAKQFWNAVAQVRGAAVPFPEESK